MAGSSMVSVGISENDKARFAAVRKRAEKTGVLDINFSGLKASDDLAGYERTLEIIDKNKARLDRNAGEE